MTPIKSKKQIAILMATYNGERFLSEQIDSLLHQTNEDWHLYVHDDGSKDGTVSLLKRYQEQHPDRITLLDYPSQGGPCRNFLSMLEKVEALYYMFCDQDDVWLPEKIALSFQEMKHMEVQAPDKPIVIHTDLTIVDEHLHPIYDSMWKYSGIYPQYIKTFADAGGHTTIATGSTLLFNHTARDACFAHQTEKALMHDSWLCLCTLRHKGIIQGVAHKTVLYRQHGGNCLGSGYTAATTVNLKYRLIHLKRMYKSNKRYYCMLSSLGYGSVTKYIGSKINYKQRIKQGHY